MKSENLLQELLFSISSRLRSGGPEIRAFISFNKDKPTFFYKIVVTFAVLRIEKCNIVHTHLKKYKYIILL